MAADAEQRFEPIAPIVREVVVPTDPADAFALFTDDIATWWPMDGHSMFGSGATVRFEGGGLVEHGPTGERGTWGTVLDWEPGARVRLTWHPGRSADDATEVEVHFRLVPGPGGASHTLVTLEHRGWERRADGGDARAEYHSGWAGVLARYADQRGGGTTSAAPADDGDVWLVLSHTAGPALAEGGSIFQHPDFPEHVAFLGRLAERGVLVAAGPLVPPTAAASGMTVIRVPEPDADTYEHLAETDDRAVVRGLLRVEVTRWAVRTT